MEFLTREQCVEFAARVGVSAKPQYAHLPTIRKKHSAVFYDESLNPVARRCAQAVADWFPKYQTLLLWITGSPGGDGWEGEHYAHMRSQDSWKKFMKLRRSHGDPRRLYDTPGHLLSPEERPLIVDLSEPAILHGWDTLLLAKPNVAAVFLSHDDDIEVQSEKNISSLSAALTGLGLTRGDAR
jgi:hypothetical protein